VTRLSERERVNKEASRMVKLRKKKKPGSILEDVSMRKRKDQLVPWGGVDKPNKK